MSKSDLELRRAAYHEAGHVVAHFLLEMRMTRATIVPDTERGNLGHVAHTRPTGWEEWKEDRQLVYCQKEIVTLLAGAIAEEQFTGMPSEGAGGDQYETARWIGYYSEDLELQEAFGKWLDLRTRKTDRGELGSCRARCRGPLEPSHAQCKADRAGLPGR